MQTIVSIIVVIFITAYTIYAIRNTTNSKVQVNIEVDKANTLNVKSYFEAVKLGKVEEVKKYLEAGLSPDVQDQDSNTALIHASQSGNLELVKLLIENNANVNMANKDGLIPMRAAAVSEHNEIVRLLMIESNKKRNN